MNHNLKPCRYRRDDFNGCILSAIGYAQKYKITCNVFATYQGWHYNWKHKPPATQAYLRVEPDGNIFEVHPVTGTRQIQYSIK